MRIIDRMPSFLRNIMAVLLGEASGKIVAICVSIILARYFGPGDYGKYAFVTSFSYIFMVIVDFGLNDLLVRDVAKDRSLAAEYCTNAVAIKVALSALSIIALPLTVYLMGYSRDLVLCTFVFSFHLIFITSTSTITSVFRAFERMEFVTVGTVATNIATLLAVIFLTYSKGTLNEILFARVITLAVGFLVVYLIFIKKIAATRYRLQPAIIRQLMINAFPFLTIGIIHTLYFKLDIIMLSKMKGAIYVGWYTVAANDLFFGLLFIPGIISTVTFPMFSRHYAESTDKFRQSCQLTIKILMVLGVGVSGGAFVLAPQIIHLVFGSQYEGSVPVLRIIALAVTFVYARDPIGYALAVVGKVNTLMWLNIFSLVLNLVLNLALIPFYAHIGATLASLICMVFSLFLGHYFLNRSVANISLFSGIYKTLAALLVMCILIYLMRELPLLLTVPVGGLVYLGVILLFRTFPRNELGVLMDSVKSTRGSQPSSVYPSNP